VAIPRSSNLGKLTVLRRLISDEGGFTLIEVLWVAVLSAVVVGLPLLFITLSLNQQNVSSSRAAAAAQEETIVERLTRDLRQVEPGTTTTFTWCPPGTGSCGTGSASVTFKLPAPGSAGATPEDVTWGCTFGDAGTCYRQVNGGTQVIEFKNVENVTFAPLDASGTLLGGSSAPYTAQNPAFVGITVQVLNVSQLDSSATPSHGVGCVRGVATCTTPTSAFITVQDGVDLRNNSL
jgi:type II secretory pathway pseudopilin PulG